MNCIICDKEMKFLYEDLHLCESCSLVSSNIYPDPSIYDRSYEIHYGRYERTQTGADIQNLRCGLVVKTLFKYSRQSWNLLDFGCGAGSFIKAMAPNTYIDCQGFDINPYTPYCDISVLFEKYDVLTMWDLVEHLREPERIIKGIDPHFIFICTPSTDDHWQNNGNRNLVNFTEWRHYKPQEHCHYFNEKSLQKLLSRCGYQVAFKSYDESQLRRSGGDMNILSMVGIKE